MSTIGGGGSNIRPPTGGVDAQKEASADAVADTKKAVAKKVEEKVDTTRAVADKFQVKAQATIAPSPAELAKAQTQFSKEFAPEVVHYLEKNMGLKMDPVKALKVKNQIQSDPVAKQALGTIKNAIEESNREFLAGWKPPPPIAPPPLHMPKQEGQLDKTKTPNESGQAQLATAAHAKLTLQGTADSKKLGEHAKADASTKDGKLTDQKKPLTPEQQKLQDAKKAAQEEAKKAQLADQKKLDKTLLDATKDPKNLKPGEGIGKADHALRSEHLKIDPSLDLQGVLPDQPPTDPSDQTGVSYGEAGGALTGDGTDGSGGGGGGGGGGTGTDYHPPHAGDPSWGSPGPMSGVQQRVGMTFKELANRLDDSDAAECALVVLMDAVSSVDKDLKSTQNLLMMRHKVNDAMRDYFKNFELKARNIHGDQSMEWQNMSFDIGYDAAGNMSVTSYPDMTWATGTYDHVEGKGSHDITPMDGFQNNTGASGMQEAQANGSIHQVDDKTVVGLTSWRQLKTQSVPAEADFIRSQISSIKQDNDVVSQQLQKLMDLRKNIIEQFGKIYQSRSDGWDQQIALIAQ